MPLSEREINLLQVLQQVWKCHSSDSIHQGSGHRPCSSSRLVARVVLSALHCFHSNSSMLQLSFRVNDLVPYMKDLDQRRKRIVNSLASFLRRCSFLQYPSQPTGAVLPQRRLATSKIRCSRAKTPERKERAGMRREAKIFIR